MTKRRVLLTGATGYIASQYREALRERYDLRMIDIKTTDRSGAEVPGVEIADLLQEELDALLPYFEGIDTVVHSAYVPRPSGNEEPRQNYFIERSNIDLAFRIFQLSLEAGVRRVVAMSTNHAASWYETPYFAGLKDRVGPEDYPRPGSLYGWAKAAYETLGFVYASGRFGRKLETVFLRIVAPREIVAARYDNLPPHRYLRDLAGYLSPRDLTQLVLRSIETENIEDEYGIPFQIFYGVSNNARKFWSITNARRVIGYAPEDDSEIRFAAEIAERLGKNLQR